MIVVFASVILAFIHSSCSQQFYQLYNENLVSSPDTTAQQSSAKTFSLNEVCLDNAAYYVIKANGTIDFYPSSSNTNNLLMQLHPFSVNPSDVDSSEIKYHQSADDFPLEYEEKLFAFFNASFRNYSKFDPNFYIIVEWRIEQSYGSSSNIPPMVNHFQVFIATNKTTTLIVYLYDASQLQWGTPSMEISVCGTSWTHPQSSMQGILNELANGSNINVPGEWMFMIENGRLIEPVPCSAGCSFVTGTCSEPNTCSCFNGWEGVDCTTPSCPGGCVNGLCNEPFVCTCNEGWLGDDCSTAKCSNSCTNGMCHQPYNCTCDNGWEDENCTTPICSGGCGNGTCVGPGDCECKTGYQGQNCRVIICLGGEDCQGICRVPGECICIDNSTGILCENKPTTEPPPPPTQGVTPDPPASEDPTSDGLSGAAIGGIIGGIIGFVIIAIIIVFFIVCVLCCFYS